MVGPGGLCHYLEKTEAALVLVLLAKVTLSGQISQAGLVLGLQTPENTLFCRLGGGWLVLAIFFGTPL